MGSRRPKGTEFLRSCAIWPTDLDLAHRAGFSETKQTAVNWSYQRVRLPGPAFGRTKGRRKVMLAVKVRSGEPCSLQRRPVVRLFVPGGVLGKLLGKELHRGF